MKPAAVTVAQILSPTPDRADRGLRSALVPGLPVERFNRTWRLELAPEIREAISQERRLPALIPGRLGFDKTVGQAPAWSEKADRFVITPQHDGDVVPFVIRREDLSVAFQRTAKIKRQSFIGALQRLLRDGSQDEGWTVRDRTIARNWEQFRSSVVRATEVTIVVRPTNPGWDGQDLFEPYIDELGGDVARITVKGNDLNLESTPIEQAMTHAIEREYGELEVKGETESGTAVAFDSEEEVPVLDVRAERGENGSVSYEALRSALERSDELR